MRLRALVLSIALCVLGHISYGMSSSRALLKNGTDVACLCQQLYAGSDLSLIYMNTPSDEKLFKKNCLGGGKLDAEFFNQIQPKNLQTVLSSGITKIGPLDNKNTRCMITLAAAHGVGSADTLNQAAYAAVLMQDAQLLAFLGLQGADLLSYQKLNTLSESPLFMAKKWSVMSLLLHNFDMDPDEYDRFGATPLHWAMAPDRDSDCVKELLSAYSYNRTQICAVDAADSRDSSGMTPLHCLAYQRYTQAGPFIEKMRQLADHACNINASTPDGKTARDILVFCSQTPQPEKLKILQEMDRLDSGLLNRVVHEQKEHDLVVPPA